MNNYVIQNKSKKSNVWFAIEDGTNKYFLSSKEQAVNGHHTKLSNVLEKLNSLYNYKFVIKEI